MAVSECGESGCVPYRMPGNRNEHARLFEIIAKLDRACKCYPASSCDCCNSDLRQDCLDKTTQSLEEVHAVMQDCFFDQEQTIDEFLSTDEADAHKLDHANISVGVRAWIEEIRRRNSTWRAGALKTIITNWMQVHILDFDTPLSRAARRSSVRKQ